MDLIPYHNTCNSTGLGWSCYVVLVRIACLIVVKGRTGDPYLSTLRTVVYPTPNTVNGRASALSLRSVTVARSDRSRLRLRRWVRIQPRYHCLHNLIKIP